MESVGSSESGYDLVGKYAQDRINGFSDKTIERVLECAQLEEAESVLDAMGGDGNLTERLIEYCNSNGIAVPPKLAVLEYSRVQSEFARLRLASTGESVDVVWGDMLTLRDRGTEEPLLEGTYDRVLIKSGNHEIPRELQLTLYRNVLRLLKPGGIFVNLGFVFDTAVERDEFLVVTNVKDSLAGLQALVDNRSFLLRNELHALLEEAGFDEVECAERIEYRIESSVAASQYFPEETREELHLKLQSAQAMAGTLRRNRRIFFEPEQTVMVLPGEITIARKSEARDGTDDLYREYKYDFVRHVEVHRNLLTQVSGFIRDGSDVVDLGCGVGLLAERLNGKVRSYRGIDRNDDFIEVARSRLGGRSVSFEAGDLNTIEAGKGECDFAALLNVLYHSTIDPITVLRKAFHLLRPGGRIAVSGPNSPTSFERAEQGIMQQLERDGLVSKFPAEVTAMRAANRQLLRADGNYWSAEGMVELLRTVGFSRFIHYGNEIYHGCGFLVVGEK